MTPRKRNPFSRLGKNVEIDTQPPSERLLEKEQHDLRRTAAKTESLELTTKLQKWITSFIPTAVKFWLLLLFVLILADSISLTWTWHVGSYPRIESFDFDIDTYVMVSLVGSITLAVGGLVNFALKGLLGKAQE